MGTFKFKSSHIFVSKTIQNRVLRNTVTFRLILKYAVKNFTHMKSY